MFSFGIFKAEAAALSLRLGFMPRNMPALFQFVDSRGRSVAVNPSQVHSMYYEEPSLHGSDCAPDAASLVYLDSLQEPLVVSAATAAGLCIRRPYPGALPWGWSPRFEDARGDAYQVEFDDLLCIVTPESVRPAAEGDMPLGR